MQSKATARRSCSDLGSQMGTGDSVSSSSSSGAAEVACLRDGLRLPTPLAIPATPAESCLLILPLNAKDIGGLRG